MNTIHVKFANGKWIVYDSKNNKNICEYETYEQAEKEWCKMQKKARTK